MTHAKPSIRLYVPSPFTKGQDISLPESQAHYLVNVMRARIGHLIAVFNGSQGEWLAEITRSDKRSATLSLKAPICAQQSATDLWFAFAMIKQKSELVIEKASELGVSKLLAVITQHSVVKKIHTEKLQIHAIEAAEQCGRHDVAELVSYDSLGDCLAAWPKDRALLYGDESGRGKPLPEILNETKNQKLGVLIGPEGGFSAQEHLMLKAASAIGFGMGPRILRADTAAIAALAVIQATCGQWQQPPHFEAP